MSKLYDHKSGKWIFANEADVTDLVKSNRYTFPKGVDIPVVTPDGKTGTIPSENAYDAFTEGGYRWKTTEDTKAFEAADAKAIDEKNFGDPLKAFNAGVVSNLVPGGGAVMQGMASLVGKGDEFAHARELNRELSPTASALGDVTGAVLSPINKIVAPLAAAKGETIAAKALSGLGSSRAAGVVQNLGTKALGSAVEGAYFGLGDGINEAALGDPEDAVSNILAATGVGALFGGGIGAGFAALKAGAPLAKGAVNSVTSRVSDAASSVLRGTAKTALRPVLSGVEGAEYEALARIIDNPAAMETLFEKGGLGAVRQYADDIANVGAAAEKRVADNAKEVTAWIKGAPKNVQRQLVDDVDAAAGNMSQALQLSHGRYEAANSALNQSFKESVETGVIADDVIKSTYKTVKALEATGNKNARQLARELSAKMEAVMAASGVPREMQNLAMGGGKTNIFNFIDEGTEMALARDLRDMTRSGGKLSRDAAALVNSHVDDLTHSIRNHPTFGAEAAKVDDYYDAYSTTQKYLTNSAKSGAKEVSSPALQKLLFNPEKAKQFNAIMSNAEEFMPEMAAVLDAGKSVAKRAEALSQLQRSFRSKTAEGAISVDDLAHFVDSFRGTKDIIGAMDQIRALKSPEFEALGPLSKYLQLQKTLGNDVSPILKQLLPLEKDYAHLVNIAPKKGGVADLIDGALDQLKNRAGRMVLKGAAGTLLGGALSNDLGFGAGTGVAAMAVSPYRIMKTLSALESKSNAGFKLLEKASNKIIDVVTGNDTVRRVYNASYGMSHQASLEERRKDFNKRVEYINQMVSPDFAVDEASRRVPSMPGAESTQSAMAAQLVKSAQFLQTKIPENPFAGETLYGANDYWEPSDFELSQFERYSDAVENPVAVLDRIADGTVMPEEMETLKAVHPKIYGRLQEQLTAAIMEPNVKIPYEQRLMLATFFDVPADPSLQPQMVYALQQTFAQKDGAAAAGGVAATQQGKTISIDINPEAMMTDVSRSTYT